MNNILLNTVDFDRSWAYEALHDLIGPHQKVLIAPLANDEGWGADAEQWEHYYGKGHRFYERLVRPFRSYGIKDDQIHWINYYQDETVSAGRKLAESDILLLSGGYPDWMMQRLNDLGLADQIRSYAGTVIGIDGGALVQLQEFQPEPDLAEYQAGLGLLKGMDLDVSYQGDEAHIGRMIRSLEDRGQPILAFSRQGGVLLSGSNIELLGDAFIARPDDLDELYKVYEEVR